MATLNEFTPANIPFTTASRLKSLETVPGRESFLSLIYQAITGEITSKVDVKAFYRKAVKYFSKLILDDNLWIHEHDVFELEDNGVLFVKCRQANDLSQIIPRISLPFLYFVSKQIIKEEYDW
jgi:hypothetical protein